MTPATDNSLTSSDRTVHTAARTTAITAMTFPAATGPPGRRLRPAAGPHKNSGRRPGPPPAAETALP